jgi:hypothetical protein
MIKPIQIVCSEGDAEMYLIPIEKMWLATESFIE